MDVTEQFLAAGASAANGYTRRQVELLGLAWPPSKGWKKTIIGATISDEAADEFLQIASSSGRPARSKSNPMEHAGRSSSSDSTDIHMYVLALEDNRFYVGLTTDLDRRMQQHFSGAGAEWTKRHRPLQLLHSVNTGTQDARLAEAMEDEATVVLMMAHGFDHVRGGHFSQIETAANESALRAHGAWDRIKQAQFQKVGFDMESSWSDALDGFLDATLRYYEAGAPDALRDDVFSACYRLTRYRYWRDTFAPGLNWAFWNRKGILPVLLSFKHRKPVASRLASSYEVLAAALTRGRDGRHPLRRLFLLAWQAYQPPTTAKQAETVARFMEYLNDTADVDRQYDDIVSVLFPETRNLLRA